MSAIDDIAAERERQISAEGWSSEHDDAHPAGMLAIAGAAYARSAHNHLSGLKTSTHDIRHWWPWDAKWWKPAGFRSDLIKAAALIVAEIERFDRGQGAKP